MNKNDISTKNDEIEIFEDENIQELTDEELEEMMDTSDIEAELAKSEWKQEAEAIPLDACTPEEQIVLIKCQNNITLEPEEQETLRRVLQQYRPAIQKIRPNEQIKNLDDNIQLVDDEKAFLKISETFDQIEVIPFTCYVGQQEVRMKFDLYPLTDSESITDITSNLSMFKDFTDEELIVYNKSQNSENLSREEMLVKAKLDKKIERLTRENEKEVVIEYLALQLKFHGKDSSMEDMKQVFQRINTTYLYLLFNEVQKRNHLADINVEHVFHAFD